MAVVSYVGRGLDSRTVLSLRLYGADLALDA